MVRHSDMPVVLFHRAQFMKPGGRCPPDPPGFFALSLLPARLGGNTGRLLHSLPAPDLPVTSLQTALRLHPCRALSSAEAKPPLSGSPLRATDPRAYSPFARTCLLLLYPVVLFC